MNSIFKRFLIGTTNRAKNWVTTNSTTKNFRGNLFGKNACGSSSSSRRHFSASSEGNESELKVLKLFPDEPVFGSIGVSSDVMPPRIFRALRKYFKVMAYQLRYDRKFNAGEFFDGSRFVLFKLSEFLQRRAYDEIASFLPDAKLSEKLKEANEKLSDLERTKLFCFKEEQLVNQHLLDCDFQNDPSNSSSEYFHMIVCFNFVVGNVDNPFDAVKRELQDANSTDKKETAPNFLAAMSKVQQDFAKAILVANLIFSKRTQPNLDEDWTLTKINYLRRY